MTRKFVPDDSQYPGLNTNLAHMNSLWPAMGSTEWMDDTPPIPISGIIERADGVPDEAWPSLRELFVLRLFVAAAQFVAPEREMLHDLHRKEFYLEIEWDVDEKHSARWTIKSRPIAGEAAKPPKPNTTSIPLGPPREEAPRPNSKKKKRPSR